MNLQSMKWLGGALALVSAMVALPATGFAQENQCRQPSQFTFCDTTHSSSLQGCCGDWDICRHIAYENNGGSSEGPWQCAIGTAVDCGRGEYGLCYNF